jgi:hypothetical protein
MTICCRIKSQDCDHLIQSSDLSTWLSGQCQWSVCVPRSSVPLPVGMWCDKCVCGIPGWAGCLLRQTEGGGEYVSGSFSSRQTDAFITLFRTAGYHKPGRSMCVQTSSSKPLQVTMWEDRGVDREDMVLPTVRGIWFVWLWVVTVWEYYNFHCADDSHHTG